MSPKLYLHNLWNTISSSRYYVSVLNTKLSFSMTFFTISFLGLTLAKTGVFLAVDFPKMKTAFDQDLQQLQQQFPDDLQIQWNGKELTSSASQPVELPYPSFTGKLDFPATLGFIDPQVTSSDQISPRSPKSSFFYIGKTQVYTLNGTEGWRGTPLTEGVLPDSPFVVNKKVLPDWITKARQLIQQSLPFLIIGGTLAQFLGGFLIRMISLLLDAVLVSSFLKLLKRPIPILKVFQVFLHISVAAEIVALATSHVVSNDVPMYGIAFWLYFLVIMFELWNVRQIKLKTPQQ